MPGKSIRLFAVVGSVALFGLLGMAALSPTHIKAQSSTATPTAAATDSGTPAALATFAATDAGGDITIGLTNATASPTPASAIGTPNANPIDQSGRGDTPAAPSIPIKPIKATPPPTLDDLIKQFPDLKPFIDSIAGKDISQVDLADLYKKMVEIYEKQGATGLATFLKGTGLLEKLGIPLSYLDLLIAYDKGGLDAVQTLAKQRGLINANNELVASLVLADPTAVNQVVADLAALGVNAYPPLNSQGFLAIGIPIDTLSNYQSPDTLIKFFIAISQVKNVVGVKLQIPRTPAGKVNLPYFKGVGPQTIGAAAWQKAGFTGKGVRIGILDMGFGGLKGLMNGKDLPTADHVKTNLSLDTLNKQQETHGTECAQIVHGAAPDADLFIAYFDDEASYNSGLKFMLDNKVQILSYSIGSSVGPRDGTFGESLLVDQVVKKNNLLWVVAAGNEALDHTTFKYNDSVGDGQHHFDNQNDSLPFIAGAPDTQVALNWNGNWKGGEKDEYDFSVLDSNGTEIATGNDMVNGRKGDYPYQIADFPTNPGDTYYLVIRKAHAAQDNTMDIFINNAELPKWARIPDHSVTMPADSSSALTVGATILSKDKIESFSSEGPTNDGRIKPDISAPDGEILPDDPQGFFGTSGATPLIAGVAGLVLQAYPKMSEAELRAYLLKNVADLGAPGTDSVYGAGRIKLPDPATINSNAGPIATSTPGGLGKTPTPSKSAGPTKTPIKAPNPTRVAPTAAPKATPTAANNSGPGLSGGNSSSAASASITDTAIKFNVTTNGVKGVQINVSFEVDGLKDSTGVIALQVFETDGTPVPAKSKEYNIGGTLGTGEVLAPGYDQTLYDSYPLFLPNAQFSGLSKGKHDLIYVITVLDASDTSNPVILTQSDPVPITVTR